jgi:hypothetical protein
MTGFHKAERKQAKLRLAISGPSGSGKTLSALLIAKGIAPAGKIAVVDTEEGSASLYASRQAGHPAAGIEFDTLEITPPYTIDKYLAAIDLAEKGGYSVLILDSISHAWAGEGGLLDKKGALDARPKTNQYTNWKPITKEHEQFKSRLLHCALHLIVTMRSKQDYVLDTADGKSVPKKVGMAPIQREGMEYEFTTVFDLAMDHSAVATKDRTSLFDNKVFVPTPQTGADIMAWLLEGKPMAVAQAESLRRQAAANDMIKPPAQPPAAPVPMTDAQAEKILDLIGQLQEITGQSDEAISLAIHDRIKTVHKREIKGVADLFQAEADTLVGSLNFWIASYKKKRDELAAKSSPAEPPAEQS